MAEPKAYEPEKLTAIVHVMNLKETETEENYVRRLGDRIGARSGTTTLRRSSGGVVGWFNRNRCQVRNC